MLKAELEKENTELHQKYNKLIEKIHAATKEIANNTCEDSIEHIENFYKKIDIPMPKKKVEIIVEIPFYADHKSLYLLDDNDEDVLILSHNVI